MNEFIKNACYYYLAKEQGQEKYHLFLLFAVDNGTTFNCEVGITPPDGSSISVVCEPISGNQTENMIFINFADQQFSIHHILLEKPENPVESEIVIHTYRNRNLNIKVESTIFFSDAGIMPPFYEEGDEVAYNCPYVYLLRPRFISSNNSPAIFRFHPKMMVPLKGCTFIPDSDVLDPDNELNENSGHDSFLTVIPLLQTGTDTISIIPPTNLKVNASHYLDGDAVSGGFKGSIVIWDNQSDIDLFTTLDFTEVDAILNNPLPNWSTVALRNPSSFLLNSPRDKDAESLPSAGLFIDKPFIEQPVP